MRAVAFTAVKYAAPELSHQFHVLLHEKARELAMDFDRYTAKLGFPEAVCTAVSRTPEFYEENGLTKIHFSWHLTDCAVDLRNKHYTQAQRFKAIIWLHERCRGSEWELIVRDHGTGPHFHIAYRDFSRRKAWEAQHKEQSDA